MNVKAKIDLYETAMNDLEAIADKFFAADLVAKGNEILNLVESLDAEVQDLMEDVE